MQDVAENDGESDQGNPITTSVDTSHKSTIKF